MSNLRGLREPVVVFLIVVAVFQFQNCAQLNVLSPAPFSGTASSLTQARSETLTAYAFPGVTVTNGVSQIVVTGGTSPYTYSVDSALATVDSSGLFQALGESGAVIVTVKDSVGARIAQVAVSIQASTTATSTSAGVVDME